MPIARGITSCYIGATDNRGRPVLTTLTIYFACGGAIILGSISVLVAFVEEYRVH